MFASGPNYDKLKTNLRLSMSRLKLTQKKKAELAKKSRAEIADFIAIGKPDRARIRVEHIIREDYYCEAMEMIEMYCDLILARFGLVKECQTLDEGLQESVSSIIWAGPRIATDVPEMKMVCDQLAKKYGELYVKGVRERSIDTVNAKLMHRLSAEAPRKDIVESYLKEIAATHGLHYEPQVVDDDRNNRSDGGVGELIDMGPMNPDPSAAAGFRPDLMDPSAAPKPARLGPAFEPPMPEPFYPPALPSVPPAAMTPQAPPPAPPAAGPAPAKKDTPFRPYGEDAPPPTYDAATLGRNSGSPFPPDVSSLDLPDIPDLPDVPRSDSGTPQGGVGASGRDVDFDELSKRFEELKRKK